MRRLLVRALLVVSVAALLAVPETAHARSTNRARGSSKSAKKRYNPPVPPLTKAGLPNIQAASAIIVDLDTGAELYAKNADEIRPIASVGKLFLALAVRGKGLPLDGTTAIHDEDLRFARGGARSRLPVGRAFLNHDLLRAMLIASDNRACTALGRAAGWTASELVAAMNRTAQGLGLTKTRFEDPSGLNGNVSTAREVVIGLKAALADPVLAEIMGTPVTTVRSVGTSPLAVDYISTDVALRTETRFPVLGGKTGYTDEARYCLAIAAHIGGRRVGMVFLGAEGKLTRFADFKRGAAWLLAAQPETVTATRQGEAR
jgi:D-alanyl-D-alanine endopeptidase (penicillin-binding protein 7)